MINRLSNIIKELNKEEPLSIIRLGNVEATQMILKERYPQIETNAGFYGTDEELKQWKAQMLKALLNADCNLRVVTCASFFVSDDVLTQLNIFVPTLPYVEDIRYWIDLINSLKTNNIGFVSYFKEDMERQKNKLDKVFNKEVKFKVPTDKWKIIKSKNTIKGNEDIMKWHEVYNELLSDCLRADCDVYFLSCGCYGVPLCDDLKRAGKKAIYIGGFLQLLFGIKGKRWDERDIIKQYYNKHWIYPSIKPKFSEQVEGWCYGEGVKEKSSPPK